ncbi:MAG: DNA-binding transcriptional ArsR family regulator [Patescibacteria group bacterium]|jgi:DNA-binding transcriptional ArsR family regulator
MKETQINIPLNDKRLDLITEALSNKTAKKILEHLSHKDSTVTDISQDLKIALNTTDYTIKKLLKAGLIVKKSYFWSVKGKKMPTYTVANKRIIITPISSNYAKYLIALMTTFIVTYIIKIKEEAPTLLERNAALIDVVNADILQEAALATTTVQTTPLWKYFALGALLIITIFALVDMYNNNKGGNIK